MTITADNLCKRFNREWVFKNFSYTFTPGQCYAITGPNGSGKSTLMQLLWGQVPPSSGTVNYHEGQLQILPEEIYKAVSIATPYMELIEEFTLLEMARFHYRFKKAYDDMQPLELIHRWGLGHAAGKMIANFSSGMKQRLKLGLAFYTDTPLLFLDEPTTNLDKKSIDWYLETLGKSPAARLVLIASNQSHEYPQGAVKIDLMDFKQVTSSQKTA